MLSNRTQPGIPNHSMQIHTYYTRDVGQLDLGTVECQLHARDSQALITDVLLYGHET